MTLADIVLENPALFYAQLWYWGEPFLEGCPSPAKGIPAIVIDDARTATTNAATLAYLFTQNPTAEVWKRYLWTSDRDSLNQQVYLGVNNGKMEIHRHIHITERFGVPVWD